jgi:hypothetical protein
MRRDIGQSLIFAAGFIAAGVFVLVSMAANLTFGLSLAIGTFDRIIYGALSLGADLMKVALPLVALILWRKQHRIFALIASAFWVGVVGFSLAAAVGFAASTRGETVTVNQAAIDSRKAWKATIERVEKQLDHLGIPRAAAIIQTEIDALLRTPGADDCEVINGPVTRDVCPKVDQLRKQRAVADRVADLEAELVAARQKLQNAPVAALMSDPQSATLSRLMLLSEAEIRDAIAFLIAAIVEIGSALGFTFMVLAGRTEIRIGELIEAQKEIVGLATVGDAMRARYREGTEVRPTLSEAGISKKLSSRANKLIETPTDVITRWTYSRLDVLSTGRIQANPAYQDFTIWCEENSSKTCTAQMFGRQLTKIIETMGGRKVKINGRAYYQGVALQPQAKPTARTKVAA